MRHSNRMLLLIMAVMMLVGGLITTNVFVVAAGKLHFPSGTHLDDYVSTSNVRYQTQKAKRGQIYDRNGTVLAQDSTTYNIIAILDKNRESRKGQVAYVDDPLMTARALAPILEMEESQLYEYLTRDAKQVELGNKGRNLSKETKEKIEALNLNGIEFVQTMKRTYPLGSFASYLIGYAQKDDKGEITGRMGIEKYLNAALSGEDGYKREQRDKAGNTLPGMKAEEKRAVNGHDVVLTLDQGIQQALEQAFAITAEQFEMDKAWGSVMEVKTGKILAWGQSPSFDPNEMNISEYVNYVSQMPYEPGSTFKPFTYAAAIDSGNYDGEKLIDSSRFYYGAQNRTPFRVTANDKRKIGSIGNASGKQWGLIPYDLGLVYSSNVVTSSIVSDVITPEIFADYLDRFGFFKMVDTDGIPETNGIMNYTWPADKLALSYGQGSTVTMLQMLQAYTGIFNDGVMVKPYVIDQIRSSYDDQDVIYRGKTQVVGHPIEEATALKVQQLMYETANRDDGTARFYRIPETTIIAKTGTTQRAGTSGEGYNTGKTIVSLVAAMPAEDPQVMVYYAFEGNYEKNAHLKSEAVQSILRKVAMTYGFNEQPVQPEHPDHEVVPIHEFKMPSVVNHSLDYAQRKLAETEVETVILGSGSEVIDQYPQENETVVTRQKVFLLTDAFQICMPDMSGWTRKEINGFWRASGIAVLTEGTGRVVSQNIPPGVPLPIEEGTTIEVVMKE